MKNLGILIIAIIGVTIYTSCKKVTGSVTTPTGQAFNPIKTNNYIVYRVDSTIYDDFSGTTYNTKCYFKDVIDTSYQDLTNQKAYFVLRYYKKLPTDTFKFYTIYTIKQTSSMYEMMYDNLRFIKMVYPITYNGSWNGNIYIIQNGTQEKYNWMFDWKYQYTNFGKPFSTDSLHFDKTITVNQVNLAEGDTSKNKEFGAYTYSQDRYAENKGLIYSNLVYWKKDPSIAGGNKGGFDAKFYAIEFNY